MEHKIWRRLGLIIVSSLLSLLITACAQGSAPEETLSRERPAVPIEVGTVEVGNIAAILSYSGDLKPKDSLSLASIVPGVVEEVFVEVGDEVRAGDPLMRVEDTTYQAQLKQAQAALALAQINLTRLEKGPREEQIALAETGLEVAKINLARLKKGPREEQIAQAEAGVDAARAQLNSVVSVSADERTVAAANLARAEASLRLAQAEYDKIKWAGQVGELPQSVQLEQATIAYETALAAYNLQVDPPAENLEPLRIGVRQAQLGLDLAKDPFTEEDFAQAQAGVRQAELNLSLATNPFTEEDFAQAQAGVAQAEAVVALAQFQIDNIILRAPFDGVISEVYATIGSSAAPQIPSFRLISDELNVQVEIPENQIGRIYDEQPAALQVTAFPNEDFPALITKIAPAADTTSRTFPVTIMPSDEAKKLRAGMFVEVAILLDEKVGTLLIPRSAVTIIDGQNYVYLVSDDGQTVTRQPITTGLSDPDRVEILEGLSVDDTIVVAGLSNLSDGVKVDIVSRQE